MKYRELNEVAIECLPEYVVKSTSGPGEEWFSLLLYLSDYPKLKRRVFQERNISKEALIKEIKHDI